MNIGDPAAVRPALGVTDIMTELRCLTANIALHYRAPLYFTKDYCKISLIHSNIVHQDWQELQARPIVRMNKQSAKDGIL